MKKNLVLLFLLGPLLSISQFGFQYKDSLVVKSGTDTLNMAWAGGLSHAQFSDIDYDFDGDLDLFVFDRSSDNIRIFRQEQEGTEKYYKYIHDAYTLFPEDMRYRATLVDYDNDGKKDIFTYGIGGLKVYRNVGDATNGLQWELAKDLLYSDNWGTDLNLYVSSADIPAVVDVDGDSDIDVLTFHIGGQHLQYHKNLSMETYGVPDSLIYVLKNECWGGFREDINTNSLFLNDNTPPCAEGNLPNAEFPTLERGGQKSKPTEQTPKHSGSTVLAIDYDGNGVKDLIVGDVAFGNLNLLINGGTAVNTNSDMISVDPLFPINSVAVNLEIFPAAFYVDVDFDEVKDLLVGTNARGVSSNEQSILFYKNTATNDQPNFVYQTNAFLQEIMIEHGTGSYPVLADIDNDGKEDLFVGNFFRHKPGMLKESRIAYYKNTGSSTDPVFTFVDNDFLNLSQTTYGLKITPTFGDLTGDGLKDLILGLENGTLVYYRNNSVLPTISFAAPIIGLTDNNGTIISSSQYAAPQLFDLDKDGLLDLVIGKKTGELIYYRNIGTSAAPSFQLINSSLGMVDLAIDSPDGYATPHFFLHNDTIHLFAGAYDGRLHYYTSIEENLDPNESFQLVSDSYLNIQTGAYSSFYVKDLDNDNELNMIVGQDLGGLYHFEAEAGSSVTLSELNKEIMAAVYPNPSGGEFHIAVQQSGTYSFTVVDAAGKTIIEPVQFEQKTSFNLNGFSSGLYFLKITSENGTRLNRKLIKN